MGPRISTLQCKGWLSRVGDTDSLTSEIYIHANLFTVLLSVKMYHALLPQCLNTTPVVAEYAVFNRKRHVWVVDIVDAHTACRLPWSSSMGVRME